MMSHNESGESHLVGTLVRPGAAQPDLVLAEV